MAIDPIKVPQNVYIEDRIIGPVTLKQIIITGIGAGFSYALYAGISKQYGAPALPLTILIWLPAAVSAFFAFFRINDISMFHLLLLMVERINKPAIRTQAPRRGLVINIRTFAQAENSGQSDKREPAKNQNIRFDELSTILDKPLEKHLQKEAAEPLSPLDEDVTEEAPFEPTPPPTLRPVDPSRISVSNSDGQMTDMMKEPMQSAVSIFRDLSPRH